MTARHERVTAMHQRDQVISANVEFYREMAEKYDRYESCAGNVFFQAMLENDVKQMAGKLGDRFAKIRCLDCGGGTGNLTLKLLSQGWDVTVVDVSREMLEISRAKVTASGHSATFVNDSIENFLKSSGENFEFVSFSSVLHHVYSPAQMVLEVAPRIRPGGIFYSNFDPVVPLSRPLAASFSTVDTVVAKLLYDRMDFLPGLTRRLRKLTLPKNHEYARVVAGPGDLAEFHAHRGLDDCLIANALEENDFQVTRIRYAAGRTKMTRWVNARLQASLTFKIMAQRRDNHPASSLIDK